MIEGTPGKPYGHLPSHFNLVEANMRLRRQQGQDLLDKDEYVISTSTFPRNGCPKFTFPTYAPKPGVSASSSLFFPDEAIYPDHPRFRTLTRNIRERRKAKVVINVPIFVDKNTPRPFREDLSVYGDDNGTSEAASVDDSTDDRTAEERGFEPLKNDRFLIPKSRYSPIDCYISPESAKFNDIDVVQDMDVFQELTSNGIDHLLAQHIAHLFIRDTLVLFEEKLDLDDEKDTEHFENINSTNWQSMRFKPPPLNSNIGWRVEFRPTELQMTDFENAALVTFVVLLTRAIMTYNLNLLIPISNVDKNMQFAQQRDAIRHQKFHFRKSLSTGQTPETPSMAFVKKPLFDNTEGESEDRLMTVNEIINGSDQFVGLLNIVQDYLNNIEIDADTRCTVNQYLNLISKRAAGTLLTNAAWMRQFVENHPKYKHNSVVTDEITYDLLWKMHKISAGEEDCQLVLPRMASKTSLDIPRAVERADNELETKRSLLISSTHSNNNNTNETSGES
ncbi:unnamed protein product [Didymodactylos carnosus]|uniref:Glutamate--cysteine ligase n=1 Tax=Didymodactylos carnosus TaxID=1234261 RepID=A0A8S2DPJ3_9BILA|nr:unnamed protein product [Didymodactylos carnosus]CAF3721810.1 unnamed protein product [Didymodactylos carnosus]